MKNLLFIAWLLIFSQCGFSQSWNSLGAGVNGIINSMLLDSSDNTLIVGGNFTEVNNIPQTSLAVWDSLNWAPFGNNANFKHYGNVLSMTKWNGNLVVGGHFDSIDNIAAHNIAMWNGVVWQPLGAGFDGNVFTLSVYNNQLYAGGDFWYSGQDTVNCFAKWNGSNWHKVANFMDAPVLSTVVFDQKLIIGGQFKNINGMLYASIASWNDTSWASVGVGFNNIVNKIVVIEDTIYACGSFTQIPQNPCSYIAKFDGSTWQQIAYPLNSTDWTTDILKYHNRFYVCGNFNSPDDLGIINGNSYDSIGSTNGFLLCMAVYKDQLFIAGSFNEIGSGTYSSIARLDTSINIGVEFLYNNKEVLLCPSVSSFGSILNLMGPKELISNISIYSITGKLMCSIKPLSFPLTSTLFHPSIYIAQIQFIDGSISTQKFQVIK